jgi:hypothetical protein
LPRRATWCSSARRMRNVESGKKIFMIRKAGSYVVEADYVAQEPGFPGQAKM